MTLNLISGYTYPKMAYLLSEHLNVPILNMFGYLTRSRRVDVISAEIPKCSEIFIIDTSCIELNDTNDALLELMFIINLCKNISNSKINVGKLEKFK